MQKSRADWALWWVHKGFAVFPCIPRSKNPAIKGGYLSATQDEMKIATWWSKADYNIGLAIPAGILVADFDSFSGEHLLATEEMNTPETLVVRTPGKGGGRHLFYRLPVGVEIGPKVAVMPGMDIRTKGSYVIAPPSIHPDGGVYSLEDVEYAETFSINELPICPAWIIEACTDRPEFHDEHRDKVNLLGMLQGIEPGARQVGLFRAACSMRTRGFEKELAKFILDKIVDASEGPGYKKKPNVQLLIDRVWKKYEGGQRPQDQKTWTLDELMAHDFGGANWFVNDLLGPGVAIVYANPKVGKTQAVASLCLSIATREKVWGRFVVPKARGILYLDLEQSERAAQERWTRSLDGRTPPANLRVVFNWPRMDAGGLEDIKQYLQMNPDVDVIVIDVMSLFLPNSTQPGANAYHVDYGIYDKLKKISKEYGCLFISVDHTAKDGTLTGSMGKKGSADYLFEIRREPGATDALINVEGKNIGSHSLAMSVDLDKFGWKVVAVN